MNIGIKMEENKDDPDDNALSNKLQVCNINQ
jgi:hypothetical protein